MWFMSNLQTSIYGIAPVVNATEVNAFITYYKPLVSTKKS